MNEFQQKEKLEEVLSDYHVKDSEICIIGSAALSVHGIRENNDIDFVTTPSIRNRIRQRAKDQESCEVFETGAVHFNNDIELAPKNHYDIFGIDDEELVYNAKYHNVVDGYKIIRLELLLSKKYAERRPKDIDDVRAIEQSGIIGNSTWEWELVKPLPPWEWQDRQRSLVERAKRSLRTDGVIKTGIRGVELALDNLYIPPNPLLKRGRLQRLKLAQSTAKLNSKGLQLFIPVPEIILSHYSGSEFYGWEIVQEFAKASGVAGENQPAEIEPSKISINDKGEIVSDPSTFVECIQNGSTTIQIEILDNKGLHSTKQNVVTDSINEKDIIEFRNKLFKTTGSYFYGIIWPSADEFTNEIENYVTQKVNVVETKEIELGTKLDEFVHLLYEIDDYARPWTIEKKLKTIRGGSNKITVLLLEIPEPEVRFNEDGDVSRVTNELKQSCRKKYQDEIDEYVYDNIIHLTDNYEHNRHVYSLIRKYDSEE